MPELCQISHLCAIAAEQTPHMSLKNKIVLQASAARNLCQAGEDAALSMGPRGRFLEFVELYGNASILALAMLLSSLHVFNPVLKSLICTKSFLDFSPDFPPDFEKSWLQLVM